LKKPPQFGAAFLRVTLFLHVFWQRALTDPRMKMVGVIAIDTSRARHYAGVARFF
jgi:hypothetical protein